VTTIGRRIASARALRGVTQAKLAARVGCSTATICLWERDEVSPRISELRKLAQALRVKLNDLLEDPDGKRDSKKTKR
jgi:transcriptional regulator with XRE-family HTH domain